MGFRREFLGTGQSWGEWDFVPGEKAFRPNRELLSELRRAFKKNLKTGVDRVVEVNADPVFVSEVNCQILSLEQQETPQPSDSLEEEESVEVAEDVQRYCDYLGPHLCRIRWAAERLVFSETFKALTDSLEPRFRQYCEHGIRQFDSKDYEKAFDNLRRVLLANPSHYFACQYLGFLSVQQDDSDGALEQFQAAHRCAETDRHRALALSHLSRCHFALGKLDSACELARAAAEADQNAAAFWHEYALYSMLAGKREMALEALTTAMMKDWAYWASVVATPQFNALQPHLGSAMSEIRSQMAQKARQALDDLKGNMEIAKRAGAAEPLAKILLQVDQFEDNYKRGNIYCYHAVISEAASVRQSVQILAKETIRERISFWRAALKRAEARREMRAGQMRKPVMQLRNEQKRILANYKQWEVGCGGYLLLWLLCLCPVLLFVLQRPWEDTYLLLCLISVVVPLFIPPVVNWFGYIRAVEEPRRRIEERIRAVEQQIHPMIERVEREYIDRKKMIESELTEMEQLSKQLGTAEA